MSLNQDSISVKKHISVWVYVIPNVIVLGLWALAWWFLNSNPYLNGWPERALFGEMFGAIESLFSGLAFASLIITIYLQSKELSLQRQELEDTRMELRGQKDQLIEQNKTLRLQRFEATFFQLLSFHNDITQAIDLSSVGDGQHAMGRTSFKTMYSSLKDFYNNHPARRSLPAGDLIKQAYGRFYYKYQPFVGHYFRSLYNIIKMVDRSGLPEEDRRVYVNLLRAQISSFELLLLFYNCLSNVGEGFHEAVVRYDLLKTTPINELLDINHTAFYKDSSFESRDNAI